MCFPILPSLLPPLLLVLQLRRIEVRFVAAASLYHPFSPPCPFSPPSSRLPFPLLLQLAGEAGAAAAAGGKEKEAAAAEKRRRGSSSGKSGGGNSSGEEGEGAAARDGLTERAVRERGAAETKAVREREQRRQQRQSQRGWSGGDRGGQR